MFMNAVMEYLYKFDGIFLNVKENTNRILEGVEN